MVSVGLVSRPTVERGVAFCKFNGQTIESKKTMERFEFNRVIEVGENAAGFREAVVTPILIGTMNASGGHSFYLCGEETKALLHEILGGVFELEGSKSSHSVWVEALQATGGEISSLARDEDGYSSPSGCECKSLGGAIDLLDRLLPLSGGLVKVLSTRPCKKTGRDMKLSISLLIIPECSESRQNLSELCSTFTYNRDSKKLPRDFLLYLGECGAGSVPSTSVCFVSSSSSLLGSLPVLQFASKKRVRLCNEETAGALLRTCLDIERVEREMEVLKSAFSDQEGYVRETAGELERVDREHWVRLEAAKEAGEELQVHEKEYLRVAEAAEKLSWEHRASVKEIEKMGRALEEERKAEIVRTESKREWEEKREKVKTAEGRLTEKKQRCKEMEEEFEGEWGQRCRVDEELCGKRRDMEERAVYDTPCKKEYGEEVGIDIEQVDHLYEMMDLDRKAYTLKNEIDTLQRQVDELKRDEVSGKSELEKPSERKMVEVMQRMYRKVKEAVDAVEDHNEEYYSHTYEIMTHLHRLSLTY